MHGDSSSAYRNILQHLKPPSMSAAGTGDINITKLLLERGVGVHVVDKSGWTPLLWAASAGHAEVGFANNAS